MVQNGTIRGPSVNRGVAALAAEIGRTTGAVSRALSKGKTVEAIRETARRTNERRLAGKARGKQAGGLQPVRVEDYRVPSSMSAPSPSPSPTPAPRSYIPSRRMTIGSPGAVLVPEAAVPGETRAPGFSDSVAPVLDQNGIETEASADRRKAIALANERELTVAQKRKELLPVRELNTWFAGCIVACRNTLLRIGPEHRDRLAAETDPVKCEEMIDAEVRRALAMLKEMPVE